MSTAAGTICRLHPPRTRWGPLFYLGAGARSKVSRKRTTVVPHLRNAFLVATLSPTNRKRLHRAVLTFSPRSGLLRSPIRKHRRRRRHHFFVGTPARLRKTLSTRPLVHRLPTSRRAATHRRDVPTAARVQCNKSLAIGALRGRCRAPKEKLLGA